MEKQSVRKKKKTNAWLKVCVLLLVVVSIVEVIIIVNMLKNDRTESNVNNVTSVMDGIKIADGTIVLNAVQTPVADFVYGFEEVSSLKAVYSEKDPHAVIFKADMGDGNDIDFLKFYFDNDELGAKVAIIKDKSEKEVKLSMEKVKLEESSGLDSSEISRLSSLRDELIDTILSNFDVIEYFSDSTYDYSEEDYILTETPYCQIPFSREWEEYLVVDITEGDAYKVTFSCKFKDGDPVELFTYSFGEDVEDKIGQVKDISVGLTVGSGEANKKWSQGEVDIFYTMREEMNLIIDYLVATGEFTLK